MDRSPFSSAFTSRTAQVRRALAGVGWAWLLLSVVLAWLDREGRWIDAGREGVVLLKLWIFWAVWAVIPWCGAALLCLRQPAGRSVLRLAWLAALALVGYSGLVEPRLLTVREHRLHLQTPAKLPPLRLALVADVHAGHEKRHLKAPRQVAVTRPVGQQVHAVGRQAQATGLALRGKGQVAVDGGNVVCVGHQPFAGATGVARQQHAQLFKALADGGNGLREVQVALRRSAVGGSVRLGRSIERVDATAGEHVGAGCKAGGARAPGHQHFKTAVVRRIAQQQHGSGGAGGNGFAVGVQ